MARGTPPRKGRPTKSEEGTITPRILAAATDVFLAAGYDQANMGDVAEKAECSKRTLYLRFPSKLDLFSAFIHFFIEERLKGVRISIDPKATFERQLVQVATVIGRYAASEEAYQLHRLIVQDGRRAPELQAVMEKAAWEPGNRVIKDIFKGHLKHMNDGDLTFVAEQFLALVALRPLHDNLNGKTAMQETPDQVVDLFIRGCCSFASLAESRE